MTDSIWSVLNDLMCEINRPKISVSWLVVVGGIETMMTAIDLFCGCGGASIGLARAGFDVRLGLDNEQLAVESYNLNRKLHNSRAVRADLFKLSATEILDLAGLKDDRLTLLAGCPPCQGFSSVATKRNRIEVDDDRNMLIDRFGDLAIAIRPAAVMMENVPGLAENYRFTRLCRRLRGAGFRVSTKVEDAQNFGVPQRRRRLLMLALAGERPRLCEVGGSRRKTVRDAIGNLGPPGRSGDVLHDIRSKYSAPVLDRIAKTPKDGGSRHQVNGIRQLACHERSNGFKDVYGRMAWDSVSPTITCGCFNPSKGRFLHPEQDRAITLREAMLLQGFPKSATVSLRRGKSNAARMIGNAFPPALAKAYAVVLATQLSS